MLKETSCNKEKIHRQQIKKGEVTSFKTVTSSKEPHMEVESINQGEKLYIERLVYKVAGVQGCTLIIVHKLQSAWVGGCFRVNFK